MSARSQYDALVHEVCVELGFCGDVVNGQPRHVDNFIPHRGMVSADQFVEWVFFAEGMDPTSADSLNQRDALREAFVRHMGADLVEARKLQ